MKESSTVTLCIPDGAQKEVAIPSMISEVYGFRDKDRILEFATELEATVCYLRTLRDDGLDDAALAVARILMDANEALYEVIGKICLAHFDSVASRKPK
jgi:hypothetical protein